jgi:hypothetical protein
VIDALRTSPRSRLLANARRSLGTGGVEGVLDAVDEGGEHLPGRGGPEGDPNSSGEPWRDPAGEVGCGLGDVEQALGFNKASPAGVSATPGCSALAVPTRHVVDSLDGVAA